MMRLSEVTYTGMQARPIDSYGPGFFRVNGEIIRGPALVLPSGVSGWMGYADMQPLLDAAEHIDVAFIGTGPRITFLPSHFRKVLETVGLVPEPMPTPSACRTYNVLLSEGRRVGAALLPV